MQSQPAGLDRYLKAFAHLHRGVSRIYSSDRTRGRAPHKPLLLMAVMDLFVQGAITENRIVLSIELAELFATYWSQVMPVDQHGNIFLPFFHLQKECFWHLLPRPGKEAELHAVRQIGSAGQLAQLVDGAMLDDRLYEFLCVGECRAQLRAVLLDSYFSPEVRKALEDQASVNQGAFVYSEELLSKKASDLIKEISTIESQYPVAARSQGFRQAVVKVYDHRCALCGIRMLTPDGHTVVDGAHIIPWSVGHNDDPRNGMALCRVCHWAFDEGMVTLSREYTIVASPQIHAGRNIPGHLGTHIQTSIVGPVDQAFRPAQDSLDWHRHNIFHRH